MVIDQWPAAAGEGRNGPSVAPHVLESVRPKPCPITTRGPREARLHTDGHPAPCQGQVTSAPSNSPYLFVVQGCTRGLSTKNCLLSSMNRFDCSGVSSSVKIAFTGHTGSHAPQSIHSSGCMKS